MITCERCGNGIPENLAICPKCGTVTSQAQDTISPTTSYGSFAGSLAYEPPASNEGDQLHFAAFPSQEYSYQQQSGHYAQPYASTPVYQQTQFTFPTFNSNTSTPLIVELLFSFFLGIFGIGWLMAGEIVTGIILLACSLFIYLPLLIISIFIAFFTFGLSLFCTGPLVIGAIILNAILLNSKLKHKAASHMRVQPD